VPGQLSQYSDGLQAGQPGFNSLKGQEISPYSTASKPALGPNQSPIQWVPGGSFPGRRGLSDRGVNVTTYPNLVPRPRMMQLQSPIRPHDLVLNDLSRGITLSFEFAGDVP
jgi:hypothetical protein